MFYFCCFYVFFFGREVDGYGLGGVYYGFLGVGGVEGFWFFDYRGVKIILLIIFKNIIVNCK